MAEDDLFVGEVNDDVRRDSATAFFHKFKYVFAAVVIVVVALVAFMEWRSNQGEQAGAAQVSAIELALAGDPSAKDALNALSTQSALSELMLGKIEQDDGNTEAALAAYQKVADNSSYLEGERALARLRIFELDESFDGAELMNPGAPFEVEAKLIEAERRHANADIDGAVEIVRGLMQNDNAQQIRSVLETTLLAWGVEVADPANQELGQNLEEPTVEN